MILNQWFNANKISNWGLWDFSILSHDIFRANRL